MKIQKSHIDYLFLIQSPNRYLFVTGTVVNGDDPAGHETDTALLFLTYIIIVNK